MGSSSQHICTQEARVEQRNMLYIGWGRQVVFSKPTTNLADIFRFGALVSAVGSDPHPPRLFNYDVPRRRKMWAIICTLHQLCIGQVKLMNFVCPDGKVAILSMGRGTFSAWFKYCYRISYQLGNKKLFMAWDFNMPRATVEPIRPLQSWFDWARYISMNWIEPAESLAR